MEGRKVALVVAAGAGLYVAYKYFIVPDTSEYGLLNPLIAPETSAIGDTVKITLYIKNNSMTAADVIVRAEVHEVNEEVGHVGTPYVSPKYNIKAAETWSPSFNWVATGKVGGKWLVVWLYKGDGRTLTTNTSPKNPNFFKQTFDVRAVGSGNITYQQPLVNGIAQPHVQIGATIAINCPVTLIGVTSSTTVTGHIDIFQESGIPQIQGRLINSFPVTTTMLVPNQMAYLAVSTVADSVVKPKQIRVFLTPSGSSEVRSQLFSNAY